MSTTRKTRVPMSEQLKLINQCRQSGLTDADWCRENGIAPSTFYNWVSRCRKAASDQIQEHSYGHLESPRSKQEVVPVEIVPKPKPEPVTTSAFTQHELNLDNSHTIEIAIKDLKIRITNETDPILLSRTLHMLQEFLC